MLSRSGNWKTTLPAAPQAPNCSSPSPPIATAPSGQKRGEMHQCHGFQHVFSTCLILSLLLQTLHNQAIFLRTSSKASRAQYLGSAKPMREGQQRNRLTFSKERQHGKAMKERGKQEQALEHPSLPPRNPLIPHMTLKVTFSEERPRHGPRGPSILGGCLFPKQHAETPRSSPASTEATVRSQHPSTYLAR